MKYIILEQKKEKNLKEKNLKEENLRKENLEKDKIFKDLKSLKKSNDLKDTIEFIVNREK